MNLINILYHPSSLRPLDEFDELVKTIIFVDFKFYVFYVHPLIWDRASRDFSIFLDLIDDVLPAEFARSPFPMQHQSYNIPCHGVGEIKYNWISYPIDKYKPFSKLTCPDIVEIKGEDFGLHYRCNRLFNRVESQLMTNAPHILKNKKQEYFINRMKTKPVKAVVNYLAKYIISLPWGCCEMSEEYKKLYRDNLIPGIVEKISRIVNNRTWLVEREANKIKMENGHYLNSSCIAFKKCARCDNNRHVHVFTRSLSVCNECISRDKARYNLIAQGWPKEEISEDLISVKLNQLELKTTINKILKPHLC